VTPAISANLDESQLLLDRVRLHGSLAAGRVALAGPDGTVTYDRLSRRVDAIGRSLRRCGLGRGTVVAAYMGRTTDTMTTALAIMASGASYTIVEDADNTAEHRRRLMSIGPDLVITTPRHVSGVRELGLRAVHLSALEGESSVPITGAGVAPEDIAYVLFTSGSTGRPKGVAVTHRNICHYTTSLLARLGIDQPLRYAHVSALSADLGNTSLLLALWTGGTLHLAGDDVRRDPAALSAFLGDNGIEFLKLTPSHWRAVLGRAGRRAQPLGLEYLVLGGERLTRRLATEILRSNATRVLVNHYGPTETTVGVTVHVMTKERDVRELRTDSVPIGTPLGRTKALIRTDRGKHATSNAEGELLIGGPSVARGYTNDPQATATSFITGVEGDARFYRTGDFVRVDGQGVIEFLGRIDRQVKIHGYRVDLAHVETAVEGIEAIAAASVHHLEVGGRPMLVALVVPRRDHLDIGALRARLAELLPAHMIPGRILSRATLPFNDNGKTDVGAARRLVEEALREPVERGAHDATARSDDVVTADVEAAWERILGPGVLDPQNDFFALGGSSIEAIQVIAVLQEKGYRVSAGAFLEHPTLAGLVAQAARKAPAPGPATGEVAEASVRRFAPAQRRFFRLGLVDPGHWNQAILLKTQAAVDPGCLAEAAAGVLERHALLRTAFVRDERGWRAEPATSGAAGPLTTSRFGRATADAVRATSAAVNASIDLARGRVFRVHLFQIADGPDLVLLAGHHLVVDGVSWRIIVDDLARLYAATLGGEHPTLPPARTTFWRWLHHVEDHATDLRDGLSFWRAMLAVDRPPLPAHGSGGNHEGASRSVWLAIPPDRREALAAGLRTGLGIPLHVALLGAFAHALADSEQLRRLLVDVEGHGRKAFDEAFDPSGVVGWFTTTFPLVVDAGPEITDTMCRVHAALEAVPDEGFGYALMQEELSEAGGEDVIAPILFNYLGDFAFDRDDALRLSPSRWPLAPARGPANDRAAELKLTGRTVDGHLVIDLSFASERYVTERMVDLLQQASRSLGRAAGLPPSDQERIVVEDGSSTGLLTYAPSAVFDPPARRYESVLLTGATGYVGVHVLHELLHATSAHITCLVRAEDDQAATRRLHSAFGWYHPGDALDGYAGRVTAVGGDVREARFGVTSDLWDRLVTTIDAVYHFAADTRLFGARSAFERANVDAVATAIELARSGPRKDLHHMSTLAVAGVNPHAEPVAFTEETLDIGQEFQNAYEQTKYEAERRLAAHAAEGGAVFVYRAGNISAHSQTGHFQRNAADNRLVQILRAAVKAGKWPARRYEVVLSPVDAVARGIVALSISGEVQGGTFHVENDAGTPVSAIFDALVELGVPLEPSSQPDFATLFAACGETADRDMALGRFWASRPDRNVSYSHARTHALLRRLGCPFPPADRPWIRRFVESLIEMEALGPIDDTPRYDHATA
jgi:amino acid adenylation domain-containing protein/thioester reductase-like protein/non-ribosomal peptide synthase protein (TIGR01720 family)